MTKRIEEFIKTASKEQKSVLFKIHELGEQEQKLVEAYNKKIEPHQKAIRDTNELKDGQYAKIIREDANDLALITTFDEREKLQNIRNEIKKYVMKAVELGMEDVGFIERNYEHYVGETLLQ